MGFQFHSYDGSSRISGIEYLPAGAIKPTVGLALALSGGLLAVASGTTAPAYISLCEKDSACAAGDIIPVARVNHDMTFETSFSASATSIKLGDKVTISADGEQVTATKTDGVAEVVYMDGTAKDSMCRVRF